MTGRAILWRRLDCHGMEIASVEHGNPNWHLHGTVLVMQDGTWKLSSMPTFYFWDYNWYQELPQ